MNQKIRQLAAGLMVCYVVLFVALNYWQVGQKEELDAKFDNTRQVLREFNRPRGEIISADGVVVARSLPDTTNESLDFVRDYPTGDLMSNVTGYFTKDFGSTQVERQYGDVLVGSTVAQQVRGLGNLLDGNVDNAGSVQLTLRHDAQLAAKFALGAREGSVTVTDPNTGAVIAMYSNPTYDPNDFVGVPFEEARDAITELQNADGNPLLANAYQERYMPGSTFKVITAGIGLESGVLTRETNFPRERQYVPPQTNDPINNYNGSQCGGDMAEVFRRSCNIPFAKTAIELGVDRFVAGTKNWGIDEQLPIDLPRAATSTIGNVENLDKALPLLAIRGFGQSEVQMVPLHMAMVAGAVANGGQMMSPYVVDATFDQAGRELDRTSPSLWKTPISPATAALETEFMTGVVQSGTASCCMTLDGGIQAAAKTGTAELGLDSNPDLSHAWIIAFAPAENPRFAISVVLTNVQSTQDVSATGGRLAGPIAKDMLDFLLTGQGAI
ncbi:MAG: penicillin-binding transpeptidase domain-containing protein [Ilumatobacter sp.]|uniref:peptidoglycan D,D-transpeptidase FtsI family protein n=1 Tax=uncultured Ilumatobacter sp. TaxID=879968 RepID=UPI00359215D0